MATPFVMGLLLSWAMEVLLSPRPIAVWRRPKAAICVHAGVWTLGFALELALFRRPYLAAANVLALELVIVLVSVAKFRVLREPFVYPDFEYFSDAIRHPRLYLPFFGLWRLMAVSAGCIVTLCVAMIIEPSIIAVRVEEIAAFYALIFVLCCLGGGLASIAGCHLQVDFNASADLQRLGIIGALWAYAKAEREPVRTLYAKAPFLSFQAQARQESSLPDLLVIQSESFFDVRRTYSQIRPDLLPCYDKLISESALHGELFVGAWGANTVRTEFSFLAGMPASQLGVHAYNPYRRLARDGFPTIAQYLRDLGYRTICVHPYHRGFYGRDRVLPKLGFDDFIALERFGNAERSGAYVSDQAVGTFVASLLRGESYKPLYVHVITMENHGPLHLETVSPEDYDSVLRAPIPVGCDDLVAYARHLRNMDAMLGTLRSSLLEPRARDAAICLYGDHVPIMASVYDRLGHVNGATNYLIWGTRPEWRHNSSYSPMGIADLALTYLETIKLGTNVLRDC